jgi:hypothetical protein
MIDVMDKLDVVKVVKRVGIRGAHFQFRQVREELGIPTTDTSASTRAWNLLAELIRDNVVEEVPGENRKRHRYYRVKDEDKLRQLAPAPSAPVSVSGKPGALPDRLGRIESDIRFILERLDQLDSKIGQLVSVWS